VKPLSTLFSETDTPGSTAPLESITVPLILPFTVLWANTPPVNNEVITTVKTNSLFRILNRMFSSNIDSHNSIYMTICIGFVSPELRNTEARCSPTFTEEQTDMIWISVG
jgi:hypothetical protein